MIHKGLHLKVYDEYFDVDVHRPRQCEITGYVGRMVEVTHIDASGMGGRPSAHKIENLMALHKKLHEEFGDKKAYKSWLRRIHEEYMKDETPWAEKHPGDPILTFFLKKYNLVFGK